jgi:hypothetical protein
LYIITPRVSDDIFRLLSIRSSGALIGLMFMICLCHPAEHLIICTLFQVEGNVVS